MRKFLKENRIEVFLVLIIYFITANSAGFALLFDDLCAVYAGWETREPEKGLWTGRRSAFCDFQNFFDGLAWAWFLFGSLLLGWTIVFRNNR